MTTKSNFNMSEWKEFPLSKLFDITFGNKFDYNKMTESNNTQIAFVSRTASNNGVSGWVEEVEGVKPYPAGCLTVALGGSLGATFVQPKQFYTGQNVAVLADKKTNERILTIEEKLFMAMLIKKECDSRFVPFGRELNKHIKKDLTIRLPALGEDTVDWHYLDKIANGVLAEVSVTTTNVISQFSDMSSWKRFRIGNLFTTNDKGKLPRGKVHSKDALPDGDGFFYVGAKKRDNGIMYRCGYDEKLLSKGNCIVFICNGQGSVGYSNYIDTDFMASGDVALGYNDFLNKSVPFCSR